MKHRLFHYYTYKTNQLNKAAFFVALGADILHTEPSVGVICNFTLRTQHWMYLYEKYVGWIPYKKYTSSRRKLKVVCKQCRITPTTNKIRFEGKLRRYGH